MKMKKCPHCGAEIDGAVFLCPECKNVLEESNDEENFNHYYADIRSVDADSLSNAKKRYCSWLSDRLDCLCLAARYFCRNSCSIPNIIKWGKNYAVFI